MITRNSRYSLDCRTATAFSYTVAASVDYYLPNDNICKKKELRSYAISRVACLAKKMSIAIKDNCWCL